MPAEIYILSFPAPDFISFVSSVSDEFLIVSFPFPKVALQKALSFISIVWAVFVVEAILTIDVPPISRVFLPAAILIFALEPSPDICTVLFPFERLIVLSLWLLPLTSIVFLPFIVFITYFPPEIVIASAFAKIVLTPFVTIIVSFPP